MVRALAPCFVVILSVVKTAVLSLVALSVSRVPSLRKVELMLSECRSCMGMIPMPFSLYLYGVHLLQWEHLWEHSAVGHLLRLQWDCLILLGEWLCCHLLFDLWCLSRCVLDLALLSQGNLALQSQLAWCGLGGFMHKAV